MESSKPGWSDERVERLMGGLLRVGVLTSGLVILIGGLMYLFENSHAPADYRDFHGEPANLCSIGGIVASALTLNGRGIIQFGLLLLIATPVARVVLSVVAFLRQRDYLYVVITLIVLGVLVYSFFSGS